MFRDQKRDAVLDAAAAVYARDRSASMQQIAASAGISRTTLVRHFPTREDLVVALIDRVLNDATAVLDQAKLEDGDLVRGLSCLTENFRMLGQVWGGGYGLGYGWSHIETLLSDLAVRVETINARLVGFFERGQQAGLFRQDLPAAWMTGAFQGLCETTSDLIDAESMGKRQGPEFLISIFLNGASGAVQLNR